MVDAAIEAGVKRFVPSEFGSDTRNEMAMGIWLQFFNGKEEAVEYLRNRKKEISWTGPFLGL